MQLQYASITGYVIRDCLGFPLFMWFTWDGDPRAPVRIHYSLADDMLLPKAVGEAFRIGQFRLRIIADHFILDAFDAIREDG